MGLLSHRIETSEIEAGDHVYTWRNGFTYSHHGIYVGGNKVVHFTRGQGIDSLDGFFDSTCSSKKASPSSNQLPQCPNAPDCGFRKPHSLVLLSCLDCFISEGSLCRFEYGVSPAAFVVKLRGGTCTTAESEAPDIVIHRAMYLLHNGFGQYDVFKNNCEDFALYCKTGLLIQGQGAPGNSGQVNGVFGATLAAVYSSLVPTPIGMLATGASLYCLSRFCNDIGVNSASIKVEVEDMVEEVKEFVKVNKRLKRSASLDEAETPLKRQKMLTQN